MVKIDVNTIPQYDIKLMAMMNGIEKCCKTSRVTLFTQKIEVNNAAK